MLGLGGEADVGEPLAEGMDHPHGDLGSQRTVTQDLTSSEIEDDRPVRADREAVVHRRLGDLGDSSWSSRAHQDDGDAGIARS